MPSLDEVNVYDGSALAATVDKCSTRAGLSGAASMKRRVCKCELCLYRHTASKRSPNPYSAPQPRIQC
jgi:hypothetical protein